MSEKTRHRATAEGLNDSPSVAKQPPSQERLRFYEFGPFRLDPAERTLFRGNEIVPLTPKAFDTLLLLVRNSGHLLEKDELIRALWPSTFVEEGSLSNNIFLLRKALGEDPAFIETVPRRGYRFVGAVRQLPKTAPLQMEAAPGQQEAPASQSNFLPRSLIVGSIAILIAAGAVLWRGQQRVPVVVSAVRITNDQKAKTGQHLPVTDGARLFFVEGAPWTSGSTITQVATVGGETTQILTTLTRVLGIFAISPDHSELVVGNGVEVRQDPFTGSWGPGAELWVQPLPIGTPRRLSNIHAFAACWTPDQTHILYADGQAILIVNKDGSEPKELARVPGIVRGLRFSPDGRRIRFYVISRPELGLSTLWEMDAAGKDPHVLLPNWKESPYQCCGNWSADGRYYYFRAGQGNDQTIWVLPERRNFLDRTEPRPVRLTSGPLPFTSPVPVNDGKTLLVIGQESRTELLRYDAENRRFDSYFQGISAGSFDFSPDRAWISYVSYPDMTLWRSRLDGSEKTQLTFPPVRAYGPSWSPDGSKIAFTDMRYYHPWRIAIVPSSGGTLRSIPPATENEVQGDPTWTPDGRSIVFAKATRNDSDRPEPVLQDRGRQEIDQLDLDTGKVTVIPRSDGFYSPRVSPDGRYIAAITGGMTELKLFDTHAERWSTLLQRDRLGLNFWARDGKYVYVRDSSGNSATLDRVRVADRTVEPVLSLKNLPQVVDGTTLWIGLAPDGAPVMIRDRSVQEIYALDLR